MPGALEGLVVLDLTCHLSGPYCGMLLADHGADVIKIERPRGGDEARAMPPFVEGESAPFMLWNRNKRSVALDLKSDEGRAALRSLAETADILIENFRPGTMARLGFGYDDMAAINPRLIYGSISGFGQTGPYRDRGGFDLVTQGMSGLMSVCGPAEGPPHRLPIALSDVAAGMHLCVGLLSALEARHRTGKGQYVDVSLLEAAISYGVYEAAHVFATGGKPARIGQAHRGSSPYQVFETADGWITVGAAQQNFWEALCRIIGAPELLDDPRFRENSGRVANNDELVAILTESLKTNGSAHWLAAMDAAGIPCGPVLAFDEALSDPQVLAREMVVETRHPRAGAMRTFGVPAKLSMTPGNVSRPAPMLGEHTEEVLTSLARSA